MSSGRWEGCGVWEVEGQAAAGKDYGSSLRGPQDRPKERQFRPYGGPLPRAVFEKSPGFPGLQCLFCSLGLNTVLTKYCLPHPKCLVTEAFGDLDTPTPILRYLPKYNKISWGTGSKVKHFVFPLSLTHSLRQVHAFEKT